MSLSVRFSIRDTSNCQSIWEKVIATNVGAFPEFIYNGENGYVVDVDSADLAYAMEHVESSDFSLSSFLKHHSDLSWDEIAIKYIKLFQNKI